MPHSPGPPFPDEENYEDRYHDWGSDFGELGDGDGRAGVARPRIRPVIGDGERAAYHGNHEPNPLRRTEVQRSNSPSRERYVVPEGIAGDRTVQRGRGRTCGV